jgi:hypothetical protein
MSGIQSWDSKHSERDKYSKSNKIVVISREEGKFMSTSPSVFRKIWVYKYVRFEDGKVLFCDAGDTNTSHKHLVLEYKDVTPISAGIIKVHKKGSCWHWSIVEGGSFTTGLKRKDDDEYHISRELGDPFIHDESIKR